MIQAPNFVLFVSFMAKTLRPINLLLDRGGFIVPPSRVQAIHFKSELLDLVVQYVRIADGRN